MVSAAPTSTTNITGFFISVTGFSFDERMRESRGRRSPDQTAAATRQFLRQQRRRIVPERLPELAGSSV